MSHIFNGQTRWEETPQSAIKVFIANTTKSGDTLLKITRLCGPTDRVVRQVQGLREMLLQDHI